MQLKEFFKKIVGHDNIFMKARGNYAIRDALYCLNPDKSFKKILVPDQGGWLRYLDYPPKYGYVVENLKTDYGVIKPGELDEKSKDADVIIYEEPAGYFAHQPIEEIYKICKKNNCMVILDITGSIGWLKNQGEFADVIICSFGKAKPINLGYGGFFSTNEKFPELLLSKEDFDFSYTDLLTKNLSKLELRQKNLREKAVKIKADLKDYNVLYSEKDGINVIVAFDSLNEKEKIIKYCNSNNLEYTLCPRYIRVMRDAISIEIKKLDA